MRFNPWKISTLVLASSLVLVTGTSMVRDASAEPQPRMRIAVELLEKAQGELKAADNDKGGHRVKAIELTRAALEEAKLGIAFDNKR